MNDFKSDVYYKYLYFLTFAVFIILTTLISYFLTNYISEESVKKEIQTNAKKEFFIKKKLFNNFTKDFNEELLSIAQNKTFLDYLQTKDLNHVDHVESLFLSYCNGLSDVLQVRFIGVLGVEEIRINKQNNRCYVSSNLQDKGGRDYFQGAKLLSDGEFYISDIDLNKENGVLEKPIVPTMRVSTPIYDGKTLKGVFVLNYFASNFLNTFLASSSFDVSLANANGDFIVYKDLENRYSFGKDLKSIYKLKDELKKADTYSFQLDKFTIVFEPKAEFLEYIDSSKTSILGSVVLSFFLVSIPVGLLLSLIPISLNKKLHELNLEQSMLINIVDNNIFYTDTDINGNIKHVSQAFLNKMGYTKEEVVGHKPSIFKTEYSNGVNIEEILSRVQIGEKWEGESINYSKSGEKFFFHTTIAPQINTKTNTIESLSTIKVDITDKKLVEELSIRDELTGLHNRRHYKEVVDREIQRAARDSKSVTFMMLDIDHFKLYNDTYGHQMGDMVLKKVAQALQSSLHRASDYCFRMGGEEFAVVVSGLNDEKSLSLANIILDSIRSLDIPHSKNSASHCITSSLGMVVVSPKHDLIDEDAMYKLADNALYEAKERGRNRVHIHQNNEIELF